MLTACINVLATYMDTLPDEQFEAAFRTWSIGSNDSGPRRTLRPFPLVD